MYMSKLYAPTLKEDPADAELASHRLLLRADMIRKEAAGLYSYLPLAWRSVRKIENIVRDEMDAAGAQELMMPIMVDAESCGVSPAASTPMARSLCALTTVTVASSSWAPRTEDRHGPGAQ